MGGVPMAVDVIGVNAWYERRVVQEPLNVLVVGGDDVFMKGLTQLLLAAELSAVHVRADGVVSGIERYRPEALLLDGNLEPDWAAECVSVARRECPSMRLLVVSHAAGGTPALGVHFQELEVEAVLSAWSTPQELLAAVTGMASASASVPRSVEPARGPGLMGRLTAREMQILRTLMSGASNAQVADLLKISPNTVRTHVQNLLGKLNVRTRLEAVTLGYRCGLRPLTEPGTALADLQ